MWELNHKEVWAPKNWCFWTVVLEKTLESPLDCKEIQQVNPKGNQPWIFIGRTDAEAEAPILWSSDAKSWLLGKEPDAGKDWRQEDKGMTEDEMVGWHHWVNGQESEQILGVGDCQGSLVCCSPWGHKELNMTEWLNNNNMVFPVLMFRCENWSIKKAECQRIDAFELWCWRATGRQRTGYGLRILFLSNWAIFLKNFPSTNNFTHIKCRLTWINTQDALMI